MKIRFYLHNQADKKGMKRVYCSYAHAIGTGERPVRIPVVHNDMNLVIDPDYWIHDYKELQEGIKRRRFSKKDKPQRVASSYRNAGLINSMLNDYEKSLDTLARQIALEGFTPSPSRVKQAFWNSRKSMLFWDAFEEFVIAKSKEVKKVSLQSYTSSLRSILKQFEKKKGRLTFARMNRRFDTEFVNCFRETKTMAYLKAMIGKLRSFLKWCFDYGYINNEHFLKWKVSGSVSIKAVLTLDDIEEIYKYDRDEKIDRFLWLFWTGQRFQESRDIIQLDGNILSFYQGKRKKNNKVVYQVYLTPPAIELWEKYNGIPWVGLKHAPALTAATRVRLKRIGKFERNVNTTYGLKPLHDSVASHTGRISLITAMRDMKIDKGHIKNIVGHSSGDITDHYDKASFDRAFRTMQEFWDLVKDRFEGYLG